MLVVFQYPLVDVRAFLSQKTWILKRPSWPCPNFREFVRSFGQIQTRIRGGIAGWVGENTFCNGYHGIILNVDSSNYLQRKFGLKCAFRRFYFDGLAVGKYELGLGTNKSISIGSVTGLKQRYLKCPQVSDDLLYGLMNLGVNIRFSSKPSMQSTLRNVGDYLAQHYLFSSMKTSFQAKKVKSWWVTAQTPMLFIEVEPTDMFKLSLNAHKIKVLKMSDIELIHLYYKYNSLICPVWIMRMLSDNVISLGRTLRLYLLRLHAEHECLQYVLQCIIEDRITPKAYSGASQLLQRYLNSATRKIGRMERKSKKDLLVDLSEAAKQSEDLLMPGRREELLEKLELIKIRKNIFHKVDEYMGNLITPKENIYVGHVENIFMDKYNIKGQVAAAGPQASVHHINFDQIWNSISGDIDLNKLANELAKLRTNLKEGRESAELDNVIGEVAAAEISAKNGKGASVLEHLAKAGKWSLKMAEKIGTDVAAAVIKKALNL